ncbi:Rrf2 family transcriptional regulator [Leucothrix sargassi]|nr:Rrf2 family transcriptional regulator [Leucothrix sargassi]
MQLTKHTDFAFRSLIFLASMPDELATIKVMAERFEIPKSHLMKVISTLVSNGYVTSVRGKQGGVCLAKPASDISLREIVEVMENTLEPIDCKGQNCVILKECQLKFALAGARDSYLEYLEKISLADIMNEPTSHVLHRL